MYFLVQPPLRILTISRKCIFFHVVWISNFQASIINHFKYIILISIKIDIFNGIFIPKVP